MIHLRSLIILLNTTNSNNIYLLWHWNPSLVALWYKNSIISDRITSKELSNDIQTQEQTLNLQNKTLTIYSCNTWNTDIWWQNTIAQQIENHYWFNWVYAPSKYINWDLEVYEKKEDIKTFLWFNYTNKYYEYGKMNLFTN